MSQPNPPAVSRRAPEVALRALQEWEGYVVEIGETKFMARLTDLTAGDSHESEEATIPRAALSGEDNAKVRLGSIFRWVIGYEQSATGTRECVSRIALRKHPVFTEADRQRGEAWAQETMQALGLR